MSKKTQKEIIACIAILAAIIFWAYIAHFCVD